MKKVFTEYVEELSEHDDRLRQELINLMMVKGLSGREVSVLSKVGYMTVLRFLNKNSEVNTSIFTKRKIAAWIERMHHNI